MLAVLTQNGLKKAVDGESRRPKSMMDEERLELNEKTLSTIQLCLMPHVLRELLDQTTTVEMWLALESIYMTKSLANKIRLKKSYTHSRWPKVLLFRIILMILILFSLLGKFGCQN